MSHTMKKITVIVPYCTGREEFQFTFCNKQIFNYADLSAARFQLIEHTNPRYSTEYILADRHLFCSYLIASVSKQKNKP